MTPDVRRAWLPLSGHELPISREADQQAVTVIVPEVVRHEILVFE